MADPVALRTQIALEADQLRKLIGLKDPPGWRHVPHGLEYRTWKMLVQIREYLEAAVPAELVAYVPEQPDPAAKAAFVTFDAEAAGMGDTPAALVGAAEQETTR